MSEVTLRCNAKFDVSLFEFLHLLFVVTIGYIWGLG